MIVKSRPTAYRLHRLFSLPVIVYLCVLFQILSCHYFSEESSKKQDTYAGLSDTVHYVGMNTCRQCHPDIYDSFIKTGMGLSFDFAGKAKSSARFDKHSLITDTIKKLFYYPYWKNDSLMIDEFRMDGRDTTFKRTEKIDYIIGSGQHTNSHLMNVNGYVFQVPATYFTQKGTWDLPPGFEGGFNSRFSRKIELECMSCHNAYPEIIEGSENKYSGIPRGIDCERCHGPGSVHVERIARHELVDTSLSIDYGIVNPAKLPIAMQLDVCQRCHIQGNAVLKKGKSFYDFRPGMMLTDVMDVFMPVYKGDEDAHIMASHAERLKMSKCFQVSLRKAEQEKEGEHSLRPYKNALTCVTCHNPHISVKSSPTEHFNRVCKNCHSPTPGATIVKQASAGKACTENQKLRDIQSDNCVSCHMPRNGTMDIPHVTATDHFIRKKIAAKEVSGIREFLRLSCINNQNPDREILGTAYLNYFEKFVANPAFLDSAKNYISDSSPDSIRTHFHQLVRWSFLKNDYERVVSYATAAGDAFERLKQKSISNEDAWTAYRIGESHNKTGDLRQADRFLQRAVDLEPFNLEFRNKLASVQQQSGEMKAAIDTYQFILKENPKYVSAWINYGYLILTMKEDVSLADQMYGKALALDPDNEQALLNRAGTKFFLGKKAEAKKLLDRLLVLNPSNENAKLLLKKLTNNR